MGRCFICDTEFDGRHPHLALYIPCPRCGPWSLQHPAAPYFEMLSTALGALENPAALHRRGHLSHIVRRQQRSDGGWVQVNLEELERYKLEEPLPSPSEQLDNLIMLAGRNQREPGQAVAFPAAEIAATIGAPLASKPHHEPSLFWLFGQPEVKGLLEWRQAQSSTPVQLRLHLSGWDHFRQLQIKSESTRAVLMAMKFGDPDLDAAVDTCFTPAVARAGFELRRLTDKQGAGLIDDQLRVALRTSRFILADLTHNNSGAYWEAGFAEGLGRPVIYTCRRAEWEERKTHFDTNHLVTIVWDPAQLQQASAQLLATIRATLPAEARMSD